MLRRFGFRLAILAVFVASGCSGGGAVSTPSARVTTTPEAKTSATLRIVIPARPAAASSTRRSPKYISFATQSIKIVFTPAGGGSATTVTQNLTPTSAGCQGSLSSSTTCTVQLPGLFPGSYAVDFTMYDGPLDSGNAPTGNVVSANQGVPETIRAGQANAISVTLNGVPVAVAVLPSFSSTLAGSQRTGYTLSACFASEPAGTEGLTVVGLDADGNIIVGAGAPTPTLTSSDTTKATVSTPSASAPNAFALSGPATPATPGSSFTLTAAVTPLAGSPNTTPIASAIVVTFVASGCPTPTPSPAPTPSPTPTPAPAPTTVSVTSNVNPSVTEQSVTFTAVITVGSGSPTGHVAFKFNGTVFPGCSAQPVSSGQAACTSSVLESASGGGSYSITAVYSGDSNFLGSTSNPYNQNVAPASTSVSLTSSGNPSASGQSVTFTATVSAASPGSGTPTGIVTFKDGGTTIASCGTEVLASGTAVCMVSTLSVGPHSITATYNTSADYTGSTSDPLTQVVN